MSIDSTATESAYATDAIGRVVATENHPSSTSSFRFWLSPSVQLKLFDFVHVIPPENQSGEIGTFYAIVEEILHASDESSAVSSFISSDFGSASHTLSVARVVTNYVQATVLYNTSGVEMPVPHGSTVFWPDEQGIRRALGIQEYSRPIPAGYITVTGPDGGKIEVRVDLDQDYLIGPEGAHVNISGISGLATKTSYAMFLLSSIQQSQQYSQLEKASFVVLNVKGDELLSLHEPDTEMSEETRNDWQRCELNPDPLTNVTYFFPYTSEINSSSRAQTKILPDKFDQLMRDGKAFRFYYNLDSTLERFHLLFEDVEDSTQTMASCVDHCRSEYFENIPSWDRLREDVEEWAKKTDNPVHTNTWKKFFRILRERIRDPIFTRHEEAKDATNLADSLTLLRPGHVAVIDIAQLPNYLQSFIVGDIIDTLRNQHGKEYRKRQERTSSKRRGVIILFADELNKFAPKTGGARSLVTHLREVSERGRSEGIILFGAEQFRTSVDPRVTGNSSTQVIGRTTAVESKMDAEINFGPHAVIAPRLSKGELFVNHACFKTGPLKIRFPRNSYKTV